MLYLLGIALYLDEKLNFWELNFDYFAKYINKI
jgi:hypothetical protein